MTINYLAVLVCAILSMIIGSLWYGPFFGKAWMKICGMENMTPEAIKKAQKEMAPMYALQFILTIVQVTVLSLYSRGLTPPVAIANALLLCLGFIIPIVGSGAMWNNNSPKVRWTQFFIVAGYNIISMVAFAAILSMWQ